MHQLSTAAILAAMAGNSASISPLISGGYSYPYPKQNRGKNSFKQNQRIQRKKGFKAKYRKGR